MKMQLWNILILPAIDDQTIGRETKFIDQALNAGIELAEKSGVRGIELFQGSDGFLWQEQNMKQIGRLRVVKRQQGPCFAQSFNGNGKTHMFKTPTQETLDPRMPHPFLHRSFTFEPTNLQPFT